MGSGPQVSVAQAGLPRYDVSAIQRVAHMSGGRYDIMQVCMSGHCINDRYQEYPVHNRAFCPECGEPTITACPACKAPIKGDYHLPGMLFAEGSPTAPAFCDACGMAYPWHVAGVANALEVLRLEGVDEADVQEIEKNLPDITRDTPRSQAAALRVRNALRKAGKPAYDVGVKVIGDIAAAAAKSYLGV